MTGMAIELEGVCKRFGDFEAVKEMSLQIRQGEFFSMLGPSGCGKTTTLRLIAGFEQPSEGAIKLDGVDVAHVPPYKRNVNTVFQSYALFEHLDVAENVAFGLRRRKVPSAEIQQRVGEALELVALGHRAKSRPGSSPAASASASRSPARWSTARRSCCSTSRSARSTSSCASRCRSSSSASSARSGSRSST